MTAKTRGFGAHYGGVGAKEQLEGTGHLLGSRSTTVKEKPPSLNFTCC